MPLQVAIDLNIGQAQVTQYYADYLKLIELEDITKLYIEFKGDVSYFVSLCKAAKPAKMGVSQVINLLRIALLMIETLVKEGLLIKDD